MGTITLILGGVRSGKTTYAMRLASQITPNPIYIATARINDSDLDLKKRIIRHQTDRPANWTAIEESKNLSKINLVEKTAVVDCVTLWLTNFFFDNAFDVEKTLQDLQQEFVKFVSLNQKSNLYFVTNEVGMSIHPATEIGRKFTDLQGWINQFIAEKADRVILMSAGIPLQIK